MKEIELLEAKLILLQDNIKRVKEYIAKSDYKTHSSFVFGKLKHRLIIFKQRGLQITKLSTIDLYS